MTSETLLPCPFCGGEARLWEGEWANNDHGIVCKSCEVTVDPCFLPMDQHETSEQYAVRAWNTRAVPSPVVDVERIYRDVALALYEQPEECWSLPNADRVLIDHLAATGQLCISKPNDNEKQTGLTVECEKQIPDGWQPIETAPKDGTRVFVWTGNSEFPNRYEAEWRIPTESEMWCGGTYDDEPTGDSFKYEAGWFDDAYGTHKLHGEELPTHWHPLPAAPKPTGDV